MKKLADGPVTPIELSMRCRPGDLRAVSSAVGQPMRRLRFEAKTYSAKDLAKFVAVLKARMSEEELEEVKELVQHLRESGVMLPVFFDGRNRAILSDDGYMVADIEVFEEAVCIVVTIQ